MANRKIGDRNTRKITMSGGESYSITLPIEYVRKLGWQKKQKVVVELYEKRKKLIIKDWKINY